MTSSSCKTIGLNVRKCADNKPSHHIGVIICCKFPFYMHIVVYAYHFGKLPTFTVMFNLLYIYYYNDDDDDNTVLYRCLCVSDMLQGWCSAKAYISFSISEKRNVSRSYLHDRKRNTASISR